MYLLTGVLILSCVVLCWSIALICSKNPNPHWYGEESMQAYVWTPLCVSGLFFGALFIRKSLPGFPPSTLEIALVAATIAATIVIFKLLNVRKRLAAWDSKEDLSKNLKRDSSTGHKIVRPGNSEPHPPRFKKAA